MKYCCFKPVVDQALLKAYKLSKKIRNLQIHYNWYQKYAATRTDKLKNIIYMQTILQEYRQAIYAWMMLVKLCLWLQYGYIFDCYEIHSNFLFQNKVIWINQILDELALLPGGIKLNLFSSISNLNRLNLDENNKERSYESIGWIPRSITRTINRFQSELMSRSRLLIVSEYRLLKYQAIASLQYLIAILMFYYITLKLLNWSIWHPLLVTSWIKISDFLFINSFQEEHALHELKNIEDLLWFEFILQYSSQMGFEHWVSHLEDEIVVVLNTYNETAIQAVLNVINNLCLLICFVLVLVLGKKRLAIVNSWLQELFYSLSDTMKAFCIILAKDLCIGFHSPHGWEILIASAVNHLGFAYNPYILSFIVSTLPVVIDTILKYWIFRHLNRISPSIVVTYHTMNE